MAAPFLDAGTFAGWAKKPEWVSDQLAASVLVVVSDWIRDNKSGIADDDKAAQVVAFEVTRDTLLYGDLGPYASMQKTTSHSSRSGVIDRRVVERFITERHLRILGLATYPKPAYHFGD